MAVAAGRNGKITIHTSDATAEVVAEMGSWSITGPTRNMIEVSAFGDTVPRQEITTLTGQTITFEGYYDGTSTAMLSLVATLSAGTPIYPSTEFAGYPSHLSLWAQDDITLPGYGHWAFSTNGTTVLDGLIYMTNMELGQSKDGVGTISFTAAVEGADLKWFTTT